MRPNPKSTFYLCASRLAFGLLAFAPLSIVALTDNYYLLWQVPDEPGSGEARDIDIAAIFDADDDMLAKMAANKEY